LFFLWFLIWNCDGKLFSLQQFLSCYLCSWCQFSKYTWYSLMYPKSYSHALWKKQYCALYQYSSSISLQP
jgi:hypothetical protein